MQANLRLCHPRYRGACFRLSQSPARPRGSLSVADRSRLIGMRASQGESRSGRESVFTRPAHLDALIARLDAGESSAKEDDDGDGRMDRYSGRDRCSGRESSDRYSDRYADRHGDIGSESSPAANPCTHSSNRAAEPPPSETELEHELEDLSRELTVTQMQVSCHARLTIHVSRAECCVRACLLACRRSSCRGSCAW